MNRVVQPCVALRTARHVGVCCIGLFVAGSLGCAKGTARFDVNLDYDKAIVAKTADLPTVTVQLVGLTVDEKDVWANFSMNDYLQPSFQKQKDKRDAGLIASFTLNASDAKAKHFTLPRTDDIWNRWQKAGVTYVAVLSSYPRQDANVKPADDVRRRILPLDQAAWSTRTLTVTVGDDGVRIDPMPRPIQP